MGLSEGRSNCTKGLLAIHSELPPPRTLPLCCEDLACIGPFYPTAAHAEA